MFADIDEYNDEGEEEEVMILLALMIIFPNLFGLYSPVAWHDSDLTGKSIIKSS